MRTPLRITLALLFAVLAAGGLLALGDSSTEAQGEVPETRTVSLDEGWNLAGWTGPEMPFPDAIADILAVTEAAATFHAAPQAFRTWNATAPDFLNTLGTLRQGEALWILVTTPIDWVQPVVAEPGSVSLASGFNLVTWTGQSGLPAASGFTGLGTDLNAAFGFDKARETFSSFGPSRPAFVNDLAPLRYGTGVWLLMDAPVTWTQPGTSPPAQVSDAESSATLEIPRGALPAGVSLDDVHVTAIEPGANFTVEGGSPVASFRLEPTGTTFDAPVILRLTNAAPVGDALFAALIADDGSVTLLEDISLTTDPNTALSTLSVAIPHFSITEIWSAPAITIVLSPFPEPLVGEMFSVTATVTLNSFRSTTVILSNPPADKPELSDRWEVIARSLGPWTFDGFFSTFSNISPTLAPKPTAFDPASGGADAPAMTFTQTFTCLTAGPFTMSYLATGRFDVESRLILMRESRLLSDSTSNRTKAVDAKERVQSYCRTKRVTNLTAVGDTFTDFPMGPMYPGVKKWRATFSGTVVGPDGPLAGAKVATTITRSDGGTTTLTGTSDANGEFTLIATGARAGTFTLAIDSITCPGEDPVESGATTSVTVN